jgi:hypothetical protein
MMVSDGLHGRVKPIIGTSQSVFAHIPATRHEPWTHDATPRKASSACHDKERPSRRTSGGTQLRLWLSQMKVDAVIGDPRVKSRAMDIAGALRRAVMTIGSRAGHIARGDRLSGSYWRLGKRHSDHLAWDGHLSLAIRHGARVIIKRGRTPILPRDQPISIPRGREIILSRREDRGGSISGSWRKGCRSAFRYRRAQTFGNASCERANGNLGDNIAGECGRS